MRNSDEAERDRSSSMRTITAGFPDKPLKLDDAEDSRVLTMLKMIYEGGSLDGKIADLSTRDLSAVVVGFHRGNWHFFETYERTIHVNFRNQRTIFRYACVFSKSNETCWWKSLLAVLRIRALKAIIIPALPFGRPWYEQASDANRKSDDGVTIGPIKIVVTRRESATLK